MAHLDFMFTLVYMVFLEWGEKVMVLPTGKRVFKNSKTCSPCFGDLPDVFPSWRLPGLLAFLGPKTEKHEVSERLNWLTLSESTPLVKSQPQTVLF